MGLLGARPTPAPSPRAPGRPEPPRPPARSGAALREEAAERGPSGRRRRLGPADGQREGKPSPRPAHLVLREPEHLHRASGHSERLRARPRPGSGLRGGEEGKREGGRSRRKRRRRSAAARAPPPAGGSGRPEEARREGPAARPGRRGCGARAAGARLGPRAGRRAADGPAPDSRGAQNPRRRPAECQPFPWETKLRFSSAARLRPAPELVGLLLDAWIQESVNVAHRKLKASFLEREAGGFQ